MQADSRALNPLPVTSPEQRFFYSIACLELGTWIEYRMGGFAFTQCFSSTHVFDGQQAKFRTNP